MKKRLPVRLYNGFQRLALRLGRSQPGFRESEERLLEAARRATGQGDFGKEPFREGLRVLLDAYDREARLTPFGRMLVNQELAGILCARLSVEAAWKRDSDVLKGTIRRPIFIVGLPRTGTTALHHLLGQDPAHQVLEFWLAAAPGPRIPVEEWRNDPRYRQAERGLRFMYYLDPTLKSIHLLTAGGPEECRHLFLQSFMDDTFDSNATIPSYTKWFAEQDVRPSYARHRDILKLIQSTDPNRRWVLKYPAHLRNLRTVLETYPDACIVQTHRDPARVLPSICSLVTGWRGLYEDGVDTHAVARWQLDMWSKLMREAIPARAEAAPALFHDLHFGDLVADPIAAVRGIYDRFGLELSAEAEARMRAWHEANPQGKHGGHRYSAEQFGLSEDEIAERFAPYTEHFGVSREPAR